MYLQPSEYVGNSYWGGDGDNVGFSNWSWPIVQVHIYFQFDIGDFTGRAAETGAARSWLTLNSRYVITGGAGWARARW